MEIQSQNLISLIKTNKNIRKFGTKKLKPEFIKEILECGRFTPSINEPWKVNVVFHPTVKMMLGELSPEAGDIFESVACCLVIFLDLQKITNKVNDILVIGSFIENILLAVHTFPKIGAIWLEDFSNKKDKVNEIFRLDPKKFELMGIIAIGAIEEDMEQIKSKQQRERRSIEEFTEWF
jgi:nitroreductase